MSTSDKWTIVVPDKTTATAVATPGVDVVVWNPADPLPATLEHQPIDLLLIPHYFFSKVGWQRCKALNSIKAVQLPSAGYEHALPFIQPHTTLLNGRGIHDEETAELALGLILASLRGIDTAVRNMTTGTWDNEERRSLVDRQAVVVGAGAVGGQIVRLLRACGVTVTLVARHARTISIDGVTTEVHAQTELAALAATTDILVLAVPLTDSTHHLVNRTVLTALPDGALLVNVARGGVVDMDALLDELQTRRIGATLDVTDPEPLPKDHPLWHAPNTIITPHVGGNTTATYRRTQGLVKRQIGHMMAHEPFENVVRPGVTSGATGTHTTMSATAESDTTR